jgi:hypothetical protein
MGGSARRWEAFELRRFVVQRGPSIGAVIIVVWLIIGAVAAGQRGYFNGSADNCAKAGTVLVTVVAGPLDYIGINPKVNCALPKPSP